MFIDVFFHRSTYLTLFLYFSKSRVLRYTSLYWLAKVSIYIHSAKEGQLSIFFIFNALKNVYSILQLLLKEVIKQKEMYCKVIFYRSFKTSIFIR